MKKIIFSLMLVMFLIAPLVNAEQDNLGTYKQGENITLLQICGTCTYNNITSIVLPNSSHMIIDTEMTKRGMEYTYNFTQTDLLGTYLINGFGDLDGTATAWAYEFYITFTGADTINDGESMILLITTITILSLALFFFVLGMRLTNSTLSLISVSLCGIFLFIAVMSTLTFVVENLGHLGNSVNGYTGFLLVVKSIVSVSITVLVLFGLWKVYQMFNYKRGFSQ